MPKLPREYLDIRIKKFSTGFSRIVFQIHIKEMVPDTIRTSTTPIARKMSNLRALKGVTGFASAMASSISFGQRDPPYLVTSLTVQSVKSVVLSIYVNCVPHSTKRRKDFRFEINTSFPATIFLPFL